MIIGQNDKMSKGKKLSKVMIYVKRLCLSKQVQSLYRPTARFYKFNLISLNFPICSDIIHYVRKKSQF